MFKDNKRYVIFFEGSLEGLSVGAPVKYSGVQIGKVIEISALYEMERNSVEIPVVIELQEDAVRGVKEGRKTLDKLVEQGLRARLDLASLITGQLFVELSMMPDAPNRRVPNTTDYHQIPSVPSLQAGLQQTLSDLVANRPKLAKGLDEMLELLNAMTADGGAETLAQGLKSMAGLVSSLSEPNGPLLQTLDQLPAVMADLRQSIAAVPDLVQHAQRELAAIEGLVGSGNDAAITKSLTDLQATLVATRTLAEQLSLMATQIRPPVVGFAQGGLPELRGLIQDSNRAISEISRTVRDLRQDPARFLLGNPSAEGVRLQ